MAPFCALTTPTRPPSTKVLRVANRLGVLLGRLAIWLYTIAKQDGESRLAFKGGFNEAPNQFQTAGGDLHCRRARRLCRDAYCVRSRTLTRSDRPDGPRKLSPALESTRIPNAWGYRKEQDRPRRRTLP